MQWTDSGNAGFSSGTPWSPVNENHRLINVACQRQDPDSIYHFYKRMIAIRKRHDVFIDGAFEIILAEDPQIFAYLRKLEGETALVMANLSPDSALYRHPAYPLSAADSCFPISL